MNYQVISDSSCDLPMQVLKENNIECIPFYVSFDDADYRKENVDIKVRDFYSEMLEKKGVFPKSSCPSTQDFYDVFEKYAKQDIPMICICITVKFSGSFQAAINAKNMILEEYPNAVIEVINSEFASVLQGLYVLEACGLRDRGYKIEEAVSSLNEIRATGRIFFTIGDTEYLKHGGRIGKLAGVATSLLSIKPMITFKEGEIFPSGISRSRKKCMSKIIDLLVDYAKEVGEDFNNYEVCIGYGNSYEEAEELRAMALEKLAVYGVSDMQLYQIGSTIAVHTGPYPLGFGVVKKSM